MWKIILLFSISFIAYLLIWISIAFIQKYDKDHGIIFKKKEKISSLFILFILFYILQVKYLGTILFPFYVYISTYLFVCAFIDFQVKEVYDFYHYITIFVGIIYGLLVGSSVYIIASCLIQMMVFTIFIIVFLKLGSFGGGDGFFLFALLPFLIRLDIMKSIEILSTLILLSNGIFVISNLKSLNMKKLKMKEGLPFIPSLAISTYLILLIY